MVLFVHVVLNRVSEEMMNLQLPVHPVVDAVKKMMREQLLLQVASFAKKYRYPLFPDT